jgi:hypothetical protein
VRGIAFFGQVLIAQNPTGTYRVTRGPAPEPNVGVPSAVAQNSNISPCIVQTDRGYERYRP